MGTLEIVKVLEVVRGRGVYKTGLKEVRKVRIHPKSLRFFYNQKNRFLKMYAKGILQKIICVPILAPGTPSQIAHLFSYTVHRKHTTTNILPPLFITPFCYILYLFTYFFGKFLLLKNGNLCPTVKFWYVSIIQHPIYDIPTHQH